MIFNSEIQQKLIKEDVEKFLDSLGEERLRAKEQRMQNLLKEAVPDEALYREIMLALGYKNNKVQFLELAMIMPYSEIRKLRSHELIERALPYRAGFIIDKAGLSSDFDDSLKMKETVWRYKGTRPANYPEKRIKGISRFLAFSAEHNGLCSLFKKIIMDNFMDTPDKRRAIRFSDLIAEVFISTKTLGKMRALEICFNIILPFFIAYFQKEKENQYIRFLRNLYDLQPPLKANTLTKHATKQLFGNNSDRCAEETITTIKRYFGLIQYAHVQNNSDEKP